VLHEVGRAEEHAAETLLDLLIGEHGSLTQNEDSEILADTVLLFAPSHDQVILNEENADLFPEGPELERGIWKLLEIINHSRPFRVPVNIPYTGQVVLVCVDDT